MLLSGVFGNARRQSNSLGLLVRCVGRLRWSTTRWVCGSFSVWRGVTAQIKYIDRRICVCFPGLWAFGGGFKIQGGSGQTLRLERWSAMVAFSWKDLASQRTGCGFVTVSGQGDTVGWWYDQGDGDLNLLSFFHTITLGGPWYGVGGIRRHI